MGEGSWQKKTKKTLNKSAIIQIQFSSLMYFIRKPEKNKKQKPGKIQNKFPLTIKTDSEKMFREK